MYVWNDAQWNNFYCIVLCGIESGHFLIDFNDLNGYTNHEQSWTPPNTDRSPQSWNWANNHRPQWEKNSLDWNESDFNRNRKQETPSNIILTVQKFSFEISFSLRMLQGWPINAISDWNDRLKISSKTLEMVQIIVILLVDFSVQMKCESSTIYFSSEIQFWN